MRYQCPQCGSLKKPRIINYFPPITVECLDCRTKGPEKKFVKEEHTRSAPIHYIH